MIDRSWIKNLAHATFKNGSWLLPPSSSAGFLAESRVREALGVLYDEAVESVDVYNMHAHGLKQMKIYRLTRPGSEVASGFMLMQSKIQVKLEQHEAALKTDAVWLRGFETIARPLHVFEPRADAFGGVVWYMDQGAPLSIDRIVPQLMEDLSRLVYETGSLEKEG